MKYIKKNWKMLLTVIMFLITLPFAIKGFISWYKGLKSGKGGSSGSKPSTSDKKSLMELVRSQIGVEEFQGERSNVEVEKYFKRLGYNTMTDDTPWCGAFVGWALSKLGFEISKQPLRARSFEQCQGNDLPESDGVYNFSKANPYETVVVAWRNSPTSSAGHVAFFVREEENHVVLCGGNQGDKVDDTYPMEKERITRVFNPVLKQSTLA